MKKSTYYYLSCSIIILAVAILYYFIVYYPVATNEFDFWHVAITTYLSNGILPESSIGFYILSEMIEKISNIPLNVIITLPICALSFIFLFFSILKKLSSLTLNSIVLTSSLVLIFITHFGSQSYIQWWTHGLGFLFFLCAFFLVILRYYESYNQKEISILLILIIISLNFVSYKATFFFLMFLFALSLLEYILTRNEESKSKENNFNLLFLIGIVFVLSFNEFVYNEFIPKIRFVSEMSLSGLDKMFFVNEETAGVVSQYFYHSSFILKAFNSTYSILLLLFVVLLLLIILYKFLNEKEISIGEKTFLAIIIASLFSLIIYNRLGIFDMGYIVFAGFIGFLLLYENIFNYSKEKNSRFDLFIKKHGTKLKFMMLLIIVILFVCNVGATSIQLNNGYQQGYKNVKSGSYSYMLPSAVWYHNYVINDTFKGSNIATDVFTGGFISSYIADNNKSEKYAPNVFDREKISFLIDMPLSNQTFKGKKSYFFILNNRLNHFTGTNWETYVKLPMDKINQNEEISSVYSSGDVLIYLKN